MKKSKKIQLTKRGDFSPLLELIMHKKLLIFLIIVVHNPSFGQLKVIQPIIDYNKFVNLAEISIVDSNYHLASVYFDSAFIINKNSFAVDVFNAALCNSLIKNYENSYSLLSKIIKKGYGIRHLEQNVIFSDFFNSK